RSRSVLAPRTSPTSRAGSRVTPIPTARSIPPRSAPTTSRPCRSMPSASRIFHVTINVADLDRSIEFYLRLGFVVVHRERLDPDALGAPRARFGDTQGTAAADPR